MKENAKCFIKIGKGHFEEITYKELKNRRNTIKTYKDKKFIYLHGMLMEVSPEEYVDYYYEIERNRYSKKVLRKLSAISLDELESTDKLDYIIDIKCDVEKDVINKIYTKLLHETLPLLSEDEYTIIKALFYDENSLREYAKKHGISYTTLYARMKKILTKLKKLMKI